MKRFYIVFLALLFINTIQAQNQANNWYFGFNSGITFNTNPPTPLAGGMVYNDEGCTSISDASGNLLFYSDGVKVWDRNHTLMPNGTGLLGNLSSTQSALAVSMPGSPNLYYLFTAPELATSNPLVYSIVNMSLNNGFGDVTVKNDTLVASSTEKLAAVLHSNGTDVWIIVHGYPNNQFYAFLLTASGLNPLPVISTAGNAITVLENKAGYLKASSCGNRMAMANCNTFSRPSTLELFDFDNSTGIVSNGALLGTWNVTNGAYGCEFSPDNTRLYASIVIPGITLQYNLAAGSTAAIISSMDTVGISTTIIGNGALQTGPDGRIYLVKIGDSTLAAIMNPNQPAATCGYIENYITLTGNGTIGLPNFVTSYFCNIPSGVNVLQPHEAVSISPNPATTTCTITAPNFINSTLVIYDITGRALLQQAFNTQATIDISTLTSGVYIVEVRDKEGRSVMGKVVKREF